MRQIASVRASPSALAKRESKAASEAVSKLPPPKPMPSPAPSPAPAALPAVNGGFPLRLEHLRLWPNDCAPWLVRRLGHDATRALINALNAALAASPEEPGR